MRQKVVRKGAEEGHARHLAEVPDFYVGADAVIGRTELLTRDAARYRTYFPGLKTP